MLLFIRDAFQILQHLLYVSIIVSFGNKGGRGKSCLFVFFCEYSMSAVIINRWPDNNKQWRWSWTMAVRAIPALYEVCSLYNLVANVIGYFRFRPSRRRKRPQPPSLTLAS